MNKKTVVIIGLGEIGLRVLKEILAKSNLYNIIGVDKDESRFDKGLPVDYSVDLRASADIFIITVYTSEDVLDVVNEINYSRNPLIFIESTINPQICPQIEDKVITLNGSCLAYFPHRYNAGDKEHQIFNQKRVLGPFNKESEKKALEFLADFMKPNDIIITSPHIAVLSKIVENSHRFVEIALAEEIGLFCRKNNIPFEELRRCVNSKWNIGMKEARKGVYGKCLLKDAKLLEALFNENLILTAAIKADDKYKKRLRQPAKTTKKGCVP